MKLIICISLFFAIIDIALAGFMPKAFEAEFDQVSTIKASKKKKPRELRKAMSLKYQRSSNMIMKMDSTTVVCSPSKMWQYTAPFDEFSKTEKGELVIVENSKGCFVKLFDSLSRGLKSNDLYTVKKVSDIKYDLVFTENVSKQLRTKKIELLFKNAKNLTMNNIASFSRFTNNKKKPVRFEMKSLKEVKVQKGDFSFKAPDNTNTTKH